MNPVDILVILIILAIAGGAGYAVYRWKKAGKKCIGCPDSGCCTGKCGSCPGNCGKGR